VRLATTGEKAVGSLDTLKRWIIEGRVGADDVLAKADRNRSGWATFPSSPLLSRRSQHGCQ
jgi:hypothetical protein